jgi:hypothetical protein
MGRIMLLAQASAVLLVLGVAYWAPRAFPEVGGRTVFVFALTAIALTLMFAPSMTTTPSPPPPLSPSVARLLATSSRPSLPGLPAAAFEGKTPNDVERLRRGYALASSTQ